MKKFQVWKNNKLVREIDDMEAANLQDGESIRVMMRAMDAMPPGFMPTVTIFDGQPRLHAPGSAILSDAQREQKFRLIEASDKKLCERWRDPDASRRPVTQDTVQKPPAPPKDLADAYARYDERLENRWRA